MPVAGSSASEPAVTAAPSVRPEHRNPSAPAPGDQRNDQLSGVEGLPHPSNHARVARQALAVGLGGPGRTGPGWRQAVCSVSPYRFRISLIGWCQVSPPLVQLPQPPDVTP